MSTVLGPHLEVARKRDAVPDPKDLGSEEATIVLGQKLVRINGVTMPSLQSSGCSLKY